MAQLEASGWKGGKNTILKFVGFPKRKPLETDSCRLERAPGRSEHCVGLSWWPFGSEKLWALGRKHSAGPGVPKTRKV